MRKFNGWSLLPLFQRGWGAVDSVLAASRVGGAEHAHHVWLDMLVSRIKSRNALHPYAFYPRGWGRTDLCSAFATALTSMSAGGAGGADGVTSTAPAMTSPSGQPATTLLPDAQADAGVQVENGSLRMPEPLDGQLLWTAPQFDVCDEAVVWEACFPSPATTRAYLPPVSRTAAFQLLIPRSWGVVATVRGVAASGAGDSRARTGPTPAAATATAAAAQGGGVPATRPLVILLPGTGEHGYARRRECVARSLARVGVATLILEGPYYGSRKPADQVGAKLGTLMDLCILGRVTIEETRALTAWCQHASMADVMQGAGGRTLRAPAAGIADALWTQPLFTSVTLAGTSMGGLHAALSAALTPYPVGVASWLGPPSAAPVFAQGALAAAVDWDAFVMPRYSRTAELRLDDERVAAHAVMRHIEEAAAKLQAACKPHHDHEADVLAVHSAATAWLEAATSHATGNAAVAGPQRADKDATKPQPAAAVASIARIASMAGRVLSDSDLPRLWQALLDQVGAAAHKQRVADDAAAAHHARGVPGGRVPRSMPHSQHEDAQPPHVHEHDEEEARAFTQREEGGSDTRVGQPSRSPDAATPRASRAGTRAPDNAVDPLLRWLSQAQDVLPHIIGRVSATAPVSAGAVGQRAKQYYQWAASTAALLAASDAATFAAQPSPRDGLGGNAQERADVETDLPPRYSSPDSRLRSRLWVARLLSLTDITNFKLPQRTDAVIFTHASHDQYVPYTPSVDSMWQEVSRRWRGCDVRKVTGGHVSGSIFIGDTYVSTILEVIRRLHAPPPPQQATACDAARVGGATQVETARAHAARAHAEPDLE